MSISGSGVRIRITLFSSNELAEDIILHNPATIQDDSFLVEASCNSNTFVLDFPFFNILHIPLFVAISDMGQIIMHFVMNHVRENVLPSSTPTPPEAIQIGYVKRLKNTENIVTIQELKRFTKKTHYQYQLSILPSSLILKIPNSNHSFVMAPTSLDQCFSATQDEYNCLFLPPPSQLTIPYHKSKSSQSAPLRNPHQLPPNEVLLNAVHMSNVLTQLGWQPPVQHPPASVVTTTRAPPATSIPSTIASTTAPYPEELQRLLLDQQRQSRIKSIRLTKTFMTTPLSARNIIRPSCLSQSITTDTNTHPPSSVTPYNDTPVNETMNEEPEERIRSIRKVFDDSDNEDDENEETNDKPASPARHDENPEDPEAHPTHS